MFSVMKIMVFYGKLIKIEVSKSISSPFIWTRVRVTIGSMDKSLDFKEKAREDRPNQLTSCRGNTNGMKQQVKKLL